MAIRGFFGDVIGGIDPTLIFWVIAFLIVLAFTNYSLTRVFRKQKIMGTIIAVLVSIAVVYFTARKYPSFLDNVFYGMGVDPDQIISILPWIGIGLAILIIAIWGFGMLLMVVGGILIASGATGIAYERTASILIGTALFLIGLWLWSRRRRKKKGGGRLPRERRGRRGRGPKPPRGDKKKKEEVNLIIRVAGNGRTNPRPGLYTFRRGKRIRIRAKNPEKLDHWKINGASYGKRSSIKLKMNIDYKVVAVFKGGKEKPDEPGPPGEEGKKVLIIKVQGEGITTPRPGRYEFEKGKRIKIKTDTQGRLKYWIINGSNSGISHSSLPLTIDRDYEVVAVFEGKGKDPEDPKEREKKKGKKAGEASLDVIIGGRHLGSSGRMTLDLTDQREATIYVKNGGTGGILGWRASCNNELRLSRSSGKLAREKSHTIIVRVRKRDGREHPGVIINGRGAGRTGGKTTRGRVLIYFKVKKNLNSGKISKRRSSKEKTLEQEQKKLGNEWKKDIVVLKAFEKKLNPLLENIKNRRELGEDIRNNVLTYYKQIEILRKELSTKYKSNNWLNHSEIEKQLNSIKDNIDHFLDNIKDRLRN